jgi:HK97 family phage major capsid protein
VTVTIPTRAEELEDFLGDPMQVRAMMSEPGKFKEFIKVYARTQLEKDQELQQQIKEQVQVTLQDFMRKHGQDEKGIGARLNWPGQFDDPGGTLPVTRATNTQRVSTGKGVVYNQGSWGAKLEQELSAEDQFTGTAEFFQAVWPKYETLRNSETLARKRLSALRIQNSFGSEVPADGGFLIPEVLRSQILQVALESAVVRPRAQVIPMDSLRVPIPMLDVTSNVSSVFGGIVCYWTEEAASLVESQATFGRVVLDAKKLTGYAEVPNELLADAPAFASFFDTLFPRALAWYEDIGFMNGTGVGEPMGFINCPASVQVAKETGQASATIVWENIVKMFARMLPTALGNAVWICSIDTFPELATMALSVGTGGGPVWMGNYTSPGANTPPVTILGRPVYFTEKTPVLGTSGDISFVDLSYYLVGDRQMMQAASSEHYRFQNDKTAFRVIERLDGRPWLQSAIIPHNNSSATLTAFVQLANR